MEKSGQLALGRVVIETRERILALKAPDKGIFAYTIRTDAEVRKPDEVFGGISDNAAEPAMTAIAEKVIEQQRPVRPEPVLDRCDEALKALKQFRRNAQ